MKNSYLIFGGSGSLGTTLINRLCTNSDNIVYVYSRDESKHWALKNKFNKFSNLFFIIGDIRDKDRIRKELLKINPHHVIIASALKHVDICELAPSESIQTNIIGPQNVVDVVEEENRNLSKLETVLMVSTDKACSPINVYGMSKSIAERVVLEKARHIHHIKFCAVRYGNVLESRGSIIPLFLHQAKNQDKLTVTHRDMTRFVMTLDESVDLILNCIVNSNSGELFVPRLPSMKIMDLAEIFSEKYNTPIEVTGIRSGEKFHEAMINETESIKTVDMWTYFIVHPSWSAEIFSDKMFQYDSTVDLMTKEQLKTFLEEKGYLNKDEKEFDDIQIDVIRKTSQDTIRNMTE
jgi:FlaA1/EpsC-like NDP-sugar epimerase